MHDWYDWTKDIALPTLVGVGSIAVGLIAALVARQSHNLAVQVRKDEAKRDQDAARERYRDQLFRTVEPAIAVALDYRAALVAGDWQTLRKGYGQTAIILRLNFIAAVANSEDRKVPKAAIDMYEAATRTQDLETIADALAGIALTLPRLCSDERDIAKLLRELEALDNGAPRPR